MYFYAIQDVLDSDKFRVMIVLDGFGDVEVRLGWSSARCATSQLEIFGLGGPRPCLLQLFYF